MTNCPAAGQKSYGRLRPRIVAIACLVFVLSGAGLAQTRRLDTTTFVVLGEGIAAGMADAGLYYANQQASFGALVARQMGAIFPQPLVQGPGFGQPIGYQQLPVRMPAYPQTSVRVFPRNPGQTRGAPSLFVFNLSVPGMTVVGALNRRPKHPLIHDDDPQQTFVNLALGFPTLIFPDDVPLWSQVEYAEAMNPTLALVALGYHEAASALVERDPARIPAAAAFRADFQQIVQRLRARFAEVIVCTIPDPVDSAYLSDPEAAARLMRTPPFVLYAGYGMTPEDRITREGLTEMGGQFQRGRIRELSPGAIMRGAELAPYRARVAVLNTEIQNVARETGAVLYDMAALFRRVKTQGIVVGGQPLSADYMGGFYTLDGLHPGRTGHALIANDFRFPSPDFIKANSFIAGPGGKLDIFLRMQGIRAGAPVTVRKTGGANNVLSSLGDQFSYSYSVPCQASGQTATFEYTNNNAGRSGGTFRLERLAHVSCVPSPRSRLAAGDGDIVTFTGFGRWSKDGPGDTPRFVSVQISTAPGEAYVGILVYQDPDELNDVILSSANTKPAEKPLP